MKRTTFTFVMGLVVGGVARTSLADSNAFAVLTEGDQARSQIVISDEPAFMEQRAAEEIARVVRRDSGAIVPIKRVSEADKNPTGNVVLLGTAESVPMIRELAVGSSDGIGDLPLIGPDGYVVQTMKLDKANYLIIAGATPRAVYYGAVYTGEQVILPRPGGGTPAHGAAGPNTDLMNETSHSNHGGSISVAETKLTRVPAMVERAPYLLNLCGLGPEFGVEDWKFVLDGMARESINRVYFWWQSLYKPRDFPDRRNIDGGVDRVKMSNEDVNELARYAHELGMEFLIGGGAFSWGGAAALVEEYPETKAVKAGGMCPSHPKAQELQLKFSLEMLEVIHEADGFWFEPRDEHGECKCDVCQVPVDAFGSKQYGQSEMKFLKGFCKALWAKRPEAQVAWLVELYKPSKMHSEDPAYFQRISEIEDPRLHWIVVWGAWDFPGPKGEYLPAAFFSRHNIWWNKPYTMPLEDIRVNVLTAAQRGFLGFSPAFEPCFGVDYHGLTIPYPIDKMPYELTSYAFREFCWDPGQTMEEFKAKMLNRYCGPGGSMELVEDLIYLRAFATEGTWGQNTSSLLTKFAGEMVGYNGKPFANTTVAGMLEAAKGYNDTDKKNTYARLEGGLKKLRAILAEDLPKMDAIEARCEKAASSASPREKASIKLAMDFINHTRRLIKKSGMETVKTVDETLKAIGATEVSEK